MLGQINFDPQFITQTDQGSNIHVVADFDNDGIVDLITATGFTLNSGFNLWIYKQQAGLLIFQDTIEYTTSHYLKCQSMSHGDLNHDGREDLIISYSDTVRIYYQDPNFGFFNSTYVQMFFPDPGMMVYGLACADLNGDGLDDFAVTHWNNEHLNVYYQDSTLNFIKTTYYKKSAGRNSIIATDINNDGYEDLVISNGIVFSSMSNANKYSFAIYLQDTVTNLLQYPLYYAMDTATTNSWISNYASGIAVGDVNQDGFKDIVISRSSSEEVYIWHQIPGNPALFSFPPDTLEAYLNAGPVEIADLNNDNKNEIIVSSDAQSDIFFYESDPAYVFSNYTLLFQWTGNNIDKDEFSVIDINNDGWADIISSFGYGFAIRYNNMGVGGNEENPVSQNFNLYPNPVTNHLINLFYYPWNDVGKFEIIDAIGNLSFSTTIPKGSTSKTLILPELKGGVYMGILTYSNIVEIKKMVILD